MGSPTTGAGVPEPGSCYAMQLRQIRLVNLVAS